MATVPKGPGQQEVTGDLRDARAPAPTGTYKDPESGAVRTVTMGAGADALERMGWELQPNSKVVAAPAKNQSDTTPSQAEKLDDADVVEDKQDNAPGHKSETVDGPPGVPAGDPEKLAKDTKSKA